LVPKFTADSNLLAMANFAYKATLAQDEA